MHRKPSGATQDTAFVLHAATRFAVAIAVALRIIMGDVSGVLS